MVALDSSKDPSGEIGSTPVSPVRLVWSTRLTGTNAGHADSNGVKMPEWTKTVRLISKRGGKNINRFNCSSATRKRPPKFDNTPRHDVVYWGTAESYCVWWFRTIYKTISSNMSQRGVEFEHTTVGFPRPSHGTTPSHYGQFANAIRTSIRNATKGNYFLTFLSLKLTTIFTFRYHHLRFINPYWLRPLILRPPQQWPPKMFARLQQVSSSSTCNGPNRKNALPICASMISWCS